MATSNLEPFSCLQSKYNNYTCCFVATIRILGVFFKHLLYMWACCRIRLLSCLRTYLTPMASFSSLFADSPPFLFSDILNHMSSSFSSFAQSSRSEGGMKMGNDRERSKCQAGLGDRGGKDKIDALGRLLTRILRHMASELNLNVRSDGYVKVQDLLKLNVKTFANVPLRLHTIDDIKEAVRKDNKQRFSLLEENRELLIRANQGHTIKAIESESLLKPVLAAEELPVCVHGTYKKNVESILKSGLNRMQRVHVHFSCGLPTNGKVTSGMRRDVNVLIYLDVKKALEEAMKFYVSDNMVILTEGFDGVVPVKFFEKIESWPDRRPIPFQA